MVLIFFVSVRITYFVHGTTTDNENHLATGWAPGKLSELGVKQSKELWDLINHEKYSVVYCSDLKRAVDSANLTFKDKIPIIKDKRLRECDYGDLTQKSSLVVKKDMLKRVKEPFPNGESYKQVEKRIKNFLKSVAEKHEGQHIAIVAHQAPQLALDVILKNKKWKQAIKEDWRNKKAWQPGWEYEISKQA